MTCLLVELQTEELPPKALKKLSEAFARQLTASLAAQHFLEEGSATTTYGAPRRLAALVTGVLASLPMKRLSKSWFLLKWVWTQKERPRPH